MGGLHSTLTLQSRYSTGVPAAAAAVSLVAPGQSPIPLGVTDAQGRLRFALPARAQADWELKVEQGSGHRDYLELPQAPARPLAWGFGSVLLGAVLIGGMRRHRC